MLDSEFYGLLALQVKSAQFTAEEWHHTASFWKCNFPLFSLILISGMGPACLHAVHSKGKPVKGNFAILFPAARISDLSVQLAGSNTVLPMQKFSMIHIHLLLHSFVHPGYTQRNTLLPPGFYTV